jgi:hypothetical protein
MQSKFWSKERMPSSGDRGKLQSGGFMTAGDYIVLALMLATFGALMAGIVLMGAGGPTNSKYANRLMTSRVSLQGLVLLMLALMFFIGKT